MNITTNPHFQPTTTSERINSLDVIRGIALLGILLMNIVGFGLAFSYTDPSISGGASGWNLKAWAINNMLFEGTMRGLFTMLFGAGFILLTSRGENKGVGIEVADIYYRRTLWLLLFGIIHAYLFIWFGEILYYYALFGLLLFPLRKMAPKHLLIGGLILVSIGGVKDVLHYHEDLEIKTAGVAVEHLYESNQEVTDEQQAALEKWEKKRNKKTPDQVQEENEALRQGYWSIVKHRVGLIKYFQSTLVYEFWVWDILSFMLIGMAFFKWGIFQGKRSSRFYWSILVIGYAIGLYVNYCETTLSIDSNFEVIALSKAGQTYQLGRLFTTLGHIGLFMIFIKSGILKFLQNALAAVGKMALSNYLIHTVFCNVLFMGFGFGLFGKLQRFELYYVVFGIWVVQLIYSPIWFKYFKYGPAEWLWRSLSYMRRMPFRLPSASAPEH